MVAAVTIDATEGRVLSVATPGAAASIDIPEARTFGIVNYPADFIKHSQARVFAVVRDPANTMQVTQSRVLAVVRGRVANPQVRAWTFTLDGHDYYVLHLGEIETLVYDTHSQQWYNWGSGASDLWRAAQGCNWIDGTALAADYGTNVVVGDDTTGTLYFLDADSDKDDDPVVGSDSPRTFKRVTQGQVVIKGYGAQRCFSVDLLGSIGDITSSDLTDITLEYSDDRGATYNDAGTVSVTDSDITARVSWRSLGSMYAPGRLFRITDYGALRRIDSLDMEDGQ